MILMIYNKRMCREILLPNLHNADWREMIPAPVYGLRTDITLLLEVTDSGWILKEGPGYRVFAAGARYARRILKDGDILTVHTAAEENLRIIAADAAFSFLVTEKFDLTGMSRITIGKNPGNHIRYDFRDLISGFHAELSAHSDGWYLTDTSTNGVFSQDGRIYGSHRLSFGEHLNLFGLHLVFLGNTLAVGAYYGELQIERGLLRPAPEPPARPAAAPQPEETFNRSPRNLPSLYEDDFQIEKPPAAKNPDRKPWFMVVGPSLTMAIPMILGCILMIYGMQQLGTNMGVIMYVGIVTAVGSAIVGAFWAAKNLKYSRQEAQAEEEKRFNAYSNYLIKVTESLESKYVYNTDVMRRLYPSAAVCAGYGRSDAQLWSRNQSHADFLYHRLGTGDLDFQVQIHVPDERFTLDTDSLIEKPGMIRDQFRTLANVPVGISLREKQLIGLVGGAGAHGAVDLMHAVVADIAASHCYTDVKFVFLYDTPEGSGAADWECMRFFPHVWSEDRQTRYLAADEVERRDILFALSNVLRARMQGEDSRGHGEIPKPWYLIFVSDPALLEGELLTRLIYDPKPDYGMTTFLMVETVDALPNTCEDIIENDAAFQGYYNLLEGQKGRRPLNPDYVSVQALEAMGRRLSKIRVQETGTASELPQSLDFFSMYGVHTLEEFQVAERWRKNRTYNSMKALIGKKSGDADCYLDVHEKYHGPHGLIAGTTGSGKSETLQTYILSLALNFSPEDVAFFLIDFKGGGMANLFSDLPHLAGQISNLSGNQIRRAMISIKSENTRRQQIFTEHGVNNINLYTRLYKENEAQEPIPHLFIIIDEFAELKKEEPEFMRELISVAQVGRSLGVHLILATQKPSGTVDDNIWSNSRFRICLRVQDRQDSKDMLHKPDAAFLTQTGRGYLQVGSDEIYELFQTGWSGAPYEENAGIGEAAAIMLTRTGRESLAASRLKRLRMEQQTARSDTEARSGARDVTQLDALVQYLKKTAQETGCAKTRQLWMPVLGEEIFLSELPGAGGTGVSVPGAAAAGGGGSVSGGRQDRGLSAVVGLTDDPRRQRQEPLVIDFSADGSLIVCGSVTSGKSTFLQTLLCSLFDNYSPAQLQCYILDFSSRLLASFDAAPQVGGIVYENQPDRLEKFMHFIMAQLAERQSILRGGSYAQYIRAYGQKLPAILLVIDNIGGLREKSGGKYDDLIIKYVRQGASCGMYLAVSAVSFGLNDLPLRIAENIKTTISLEQSDRYRYMDVLRCTHLPLQPEAGVKGRGLAVVNGEILEFQTALCIEAEDDYARGQKLERLYREAAKAWTGVLPLPVPEIPENPSLTDLELRPDYAAMAQGGDGLPFAFSTDTAEIFGVNLRETYCYTIAGRARTGKTNVLKLLIYGAACCGGSSVVIEPGAGRELETTAAECGARYLRDTQEVFGYFKELTPEFVRRNRKKQELVREGMDDHEIYAQMRDEPPVFIFLSDLNDFFRLIYQADAQVGNMSGFMENIMEKGSLHRIYFFGCMKSDEASSLAMYRACSLFTSYKKGIHLGGNLSAQRLFSFQNIPYSEASKSMKKGLALAADDEDETIGIRIAVPLARREKL